MEIWELQSTISKKKQVYRKKVLPEQSRNNNKEKESISIAKKEIWELKSTIAEVKKKKTLEGFRTEKHSTLMD